MAYIRCLNFKEGVCSNMCFQSGTPDSKIPLVDVRQYCTRIGRKVLWCRDDPFLEEWARVLFNENKIKGAIYE